MYSLCGEATLRVEIKKSIFIATCVPIASEDDAKAAIARLSDLSATHNCWAYRLGAVYRFNDDGEPGGSAGRPILAAIDGQSYDGVCALVVRHFGGIKLGVGGLVRAYGNTVAECLRCAPKKPIIAKSPIAFDVPFADAYSIYGIIGQNQCAKLDESYTERGSRFVLLVEDDKIDDIRRILTDATAGRVEFCEP